MLIVKEIVIEPEGIFKLVKRIGRKVNKQVARVAYIPKAGKWFGYDLSRFLELPLVNADDINSGEDVLLVDAICDSGSTLKMYTDKLHPLQTAVFISRVRKDKVKDADIVGISYDKDYLLVGYGLDYNNKFGTFKCIFGTILYEKKDFFSKEKFGE